MKVDVLVNQASQEQIKTFVKSTQSSHILVMLPKRERNAMQEADLPGFLQRLTEILSHRLSGFLDLKSVYAVADGRIKTYSSQENQGYTIPDTLLLHGCFGVNKEWLQLTLHFVDTASPKYAQLKQCRETARQITAKGRAQGFIILADDISAEHKEFNVVSLLSCLETHGVKLPSYKSSKSAMNFSLEESHIFSLYQYLIVGEGIAPEKIELAKKRVARYLCQPPP